MLIRFNCISGYQASDVMLEIAFQAMQVLRAGIERVKKFCHRNCAILAVTLTVEQYSVYHTFSPTSVTELWSQSGCQMS